MNQSTSDQMQLHQSTSCNAELAEAHFQQYMGTYVKHSCTSSRTTDRTTCAESNRSNIMRTFPDVAGADFRVPALHCSFSSSLHPQYEVVKEQCDEWILNVAQPPCAAARHLLQECVLPRLVCRNIPNASSVTRLVHATKMVAWLIITDDDVDHPNALGADDLNTTRHASQVLSILRGSPPAAPAAASAEGVLFSTGMRPEEHAVLEVTKKRTNREAALAELWGEMRGEMSPLLCGRFVSTMEAYLDAVKLQATYRRGNRLPDVQTYREIRRHASFILPCFVLCEYALGIELDDATYADVRMQDFRNAATDYMCLCNDLISCKFEIGVRDYFNMPSIIYGAARGGVTLQGAVDTVADMAHDLDARCVSMLQTMLDQEYILSREAAAAGATSAPSSAAANYDSCAHIIQTYMSSLCNSMAGSLAWFLETARYACT